MKTALIMAIRADRPEHTPEAEPVLLQGDGDTVRIVLDDGIELAMDHGELAQAVAQVLAQDSPGTPEIHSALIGALEARAS